MVKNGSDGTADEMGAIAGGQDGRDGIIHFKGTQIYAGTRRFLNTRVSKKVAAR